MSARPESAPSTREITISMMGSKMTLTTLMLPISSAPAMPKDTENSTRPTASSMATTMSRSFVSGPSALYWRTTMSVAAGAVAAAMAPRVMAEGSERRAGLMRCRTMRAISTTIVVMTACRMPTVMACLPIVLSCETRNSLPMANAMKPSAVCVMTLRPSTCSRELKPMYGMFSAPRQNGPMSRPPTRYAVTAGRCTSFAKRDISRPTTRAMPRQIRVFSTF